MIRALACCLAALGVMLAPTAAMAAPSPARSVMQLSEGWRFLDGGSTGTPNEPSFDDSTWQPVSIPHTWNRAGYYLDGASHLHTKETVDKRQGIGWYRLTFRAPALTNRQRAWLELDGASRTAEVWLNGTRIGRHEGGFSRFRFDVSSALRPNVPNVLSVKTDNSLPKPGSETANTFPLTGDFFVHGGLYRPVRLIVTSPVHIDMLDFGGPGIYARTVSLDPASAQVAVKVKARNDADKATRLNVVARLRDHARAVAAEARTALKLDRGAGTDTELLLAIRDPRLWQGIEDPYLYRLEVELQDRSGKVLDRLDEPFGIRQMRLDPDKGFVLNGRPYKLHGVGLHQDFEGKGWALSDEDVERTVAILREMGANTIRLTHYQHGRPIHELADQYGLVLWDEIALVTAWTHDGDLAPTSSLAAQARQQLQELVRQNYNHPSVAVWGIANEVDFGPNRPDFFGAAPKTVPDPTEILTNLAQLARKEDPSRPSVLATCCENNHGEGVPIVAPIADASGANRYFGWYYGQPANLAKHLDELHALHPGQPLSVSEYGAGGATSIHTDDPLGGPIDPGGAVQPEEYQAYVHEESWRVIKSKPYLWASWLWNGFDFATTTRREGDSQDINTKGLVSYDRTIKKDAFYFYKANWTDTPTVHIVGRRYVDRAYPVTDVKVYSNAPATNLIVNGKSLGVRTDCPDRVCVWQAVRLIGGKNQLSATSEFPSGQVTDRVAWALAAERADAFHIDSGSIVAQAPGFGSDAFFEGGTASSTDRRNRGRPPTLADIKGAAHRDATASFRSGRFAYRLPTGNGRYRVTLTFVEPSAAPSERLFDVLAEGRRVLERFDPSTAAGGKLTTISRSFEVAVADGNLDMSFEPRKGDAIVSAVEVIPLR